MLRLGGQFRQMVFQFSPHAPQVAPRRLLNRTPEDPEGARPAKPRPKVET